MPTPSPSPSQTPNRTELHVLLVLAGESLHGLGIRDAVAHASEGRLVLPPGTLYETIHRLKQRGWIAPAGSEADSEGRRGRRKLYRLTDVGRERAELELQRLDSLVRWARDRDWLADTEGRA